MLNNQGRPTSAGAVQEAKLGTFTGNKALQVEEALLFEIGRADVTGVDLIEPDIAFSSEVGTGSREENASKKKNSFTPRLGGQERKGSIGLVGLSEPEAMRHYVRLSQKNYGIDTGLFPLGSCTMKHNPRLNEKLARLPGFADVHPLQPQSSVQGALELISELARYLMVLTGTEAVAMSPKAGAHGELAGMMAIKAAIEAKGEGATRNVVLVPESAHGTNPATAALIGFIVKPVPARRDGTVHVKDVKALLGPDVAAIMLTNPNTCGIFEPEVVKIAKAMHKAGAYFYCDGANFNAIVGKAKPGDLGIDAMHINLHKTFSTPHGGGGPGSGPVVLSKRLAPFAPLPFIRKKGKKLELVENHARAFSSEVGTGSREENASKQENGAGKAQPFGRVTAFHGQMGMFVRALSYMLSHGADGMKQASEDAVLSANYIRAGLQDLMSLPFPKHPSMHEALFDDAWLKDTGVTTLDFAKAMIDEGYHPMTMYFPLVVHGAMLIEPTESESRASLDLFIMALRDLAMRAKRGETERFAGAPFHAPRRRLDETRAARNPILKWVPPVPVQQAAE